MQVIVKKKRFLRKPLERVLECKKFGHKYQLVSIPEEYTKEDLFEMLDQLRVDGIRLNWNPHAFPILNGYPHVIYWADDRYVLKFYS